MLESCTEATWLEYLDSNEMTFVHFFFVCDLGPQICFWANVHLMNDNGFKMSNTT